MLSGKKGWMRSVGLSFLMILGVSAQAMLSGVLTKQQKASVQRAEAVEGEFVVQMRHENGFSKGLLVKQLAEVGMELKSTINASEDLYLVKVNSSKKILRTAGIKALSSLSGVEFAEPNFIYRIQGNPSEVIPSGSMFSKLWAMKNTGQADPSGKTGIAGADIKATQAWAISQGSKDVVLAVIDTGVDYTHPALKENIWTQAKQNPTDPDVHGYNAITDALDPMDDHSHGSHCSGSIGASGNNPDGVVGVTWNVRIMGVKFLSGSGSGTLADAVKAVDWAINNGAQIMSNSWGGGGFSQALLDVITRAKDKGILFVAAAGNSSGNMDSAPSYPASYAVENVLPVAATDNSDQLAYFSNFGVKSVPIAAPGVNIWSSVPGDDHYASYSGTSMACPHVAGAAALLLGKEPSLNFSEVKARIVDTGDKVPGLMKKVKFGSRLNVYNMLMNVVPPGPVVPPEDSFSPVVPNAIESEHPYKGSDKQSWTIKKDGATYMRIKFGKFDTESGYDVVTIKNKAGEVVDSFSGALGEKGFVSSDIDGDTATIEFVSDSSVNRWGFAIEGYTWSSFHR